MRFAVDITTDTTLVTTAETVVATLSGISTGAAGRFLDFEGEVTLTTGAAVTGVTLRVRRDSLTGTLVGEPAADALEAAAGSVETHSVTATDPLTGELAGATYVLTAQQVGGAANGTVSHASLSAESR